jgi:hypothetical protein
VVLGAYTRGATNEPEPVQSVSRTVEARFPHPQFDSDSWQNDFMLLKLYGVAPEWIPRISLNNDDAVPAEGSEVTVIGMGRLDEGGDLGFPSVLQEVNVSVLDYDTCNSEDMYKGFIDDTTMICAAVPSGDYDACKLKRDANFERFIASLILSHKSHSYFFHTLPIGFGDSGGPLLQETVDGTWTQVGIVSFGVGCARADKPGVYSRISLAYDWIQEMICEHSSIPPGTCSNVRKANPQPAAIPTATPTASPTPAPTPAPTRRLRSKGFSSTRERHPPWRDVYIP